MLDGMTTTTADKGEQECREAFEQWHIREYGACADLRDIETASEYRGYRAAWNRLPTNEGQDVLTDEVISKVWDNTCEKLGRVTLPEHLRAFARAIARHLSTHPAPDDQQAKDAALVASLQAVLDSMPEPYEEDRSYSDREIAMLEGNKQAVKDAIAALSATKQKGSAES